MANRAGRAIWGGIFPLPISTPIKVPMIWLITAPGPNRGDKNGKEQIKPIKMSPQIFPAKGTINFAIQFPTPDP